MQRLSPPILLLSLLALSPACSGQGEGSTEVVECEHGLPEALCPRCDPSLEAAYRHRGDWCGEHGLPESMCPLCDHGGGHEEHEEHEVHGDDEHGADEGEWCMGHGVPESHCTVCHPELVAGFQEGGDWCDEHGFPESVCPVCNPAAPPPGAEVSAIEARVVRLTSLGHETMAGIETVTATEGEASPSVGCTARLTFDADRVADIRALVPGVVRRIPVELGQRVERGDPLFVLESTQVGEIQGLLQASRQRVASARADVARKQALVESGSVSARELDVAERELAAAEAAERSAQATLRMTGAAGSNPNGRAVLRSPIDGTVVRRPAVVGLLASADTTLATVADTSVMWALCDVVASDAARVALGQPMDVTIDGVDEPIEGELTWLAAEVDPRTRTVATRAELPNPGSCAPTSSLARPFRPASRGRVWSSPGRPSSG
jgi:cobalt-zinc-cadmium efflux system membrane fusion protein